MPVDRMSGRTRTCRSPRKNGGAIASSKYVTLNGQPQPGRDADVRLAWQRSNAVRQPQPQQEADEDSANEAR